MCIRDRLNTVCLVSCFFVIILVASIHFARRRTNMYGNQRVGLSPEAIAAFETFSYQAGRVEQEECAICFERYKEEDNIMKLTCGHEFHKECVISWLRQNPTCPMCRYDFAPNDQDSSFRSEDEQGMNDVVDASNRSQPRDPAVSDNANLSSVSRVQLNQRRNTGGDEIRGVMSSAGNVDTSAVNSNRNVAGFSTLSIGQGVSHPLGGGDLLIINNRLNADAGNQGMIHNSGTAVDRPSTDQSFAAAVGAVEGGVRHVNTEETRQTTRTVRRDGDELNYIRLDQYCEF
eukprot:TRINITY_DN4727_c0_g1_i2.p1 TRINITY_DN4727_c0_g1~~TRINITY_DN4727_c0_g1_i2.p1  ORF type:complete len:308 (+),score=48.57 TRINITY_DN4727_c0_g1_i2:61-924(+)